jgi:flagellar motor switch protein FliG
MKNDHELPGTQKVAAFLLSLDHEARANVLKRLDQRVVIEVAAAMTDLDDSLTPTQGLEDVYSELGVRLNSRVGVTSQRDDDLRIILAASFGDTEADRVLAEILERRRNERPFGFLEEHAVDDVVRALRQESPGVVALVLAHAPPALSAEVLDDCEAARGLDIVRRMTTIVPPGLETLTTVADSLATRLQALDEGPPAHDPSASLKSIAEMLNFSNPDVEKSMLEGIEADDESLASDIREFMFVWEDLAGVDKRAMQKILASVDTRTVAYALKACASSVEENILGNLSSRVQEMVADERELAGAVPLSEVEEARAEVLKGVRSLMESGEYRPARAGEELVN